MFGLALEHSWGSRAGTTQPWRSQQLRRRGLVPATSPEQRSLPFPPDHQWVTQFLLPLFNCTLAASEALCCYLRQALAAYSRNAPKASSQCRAFPACAPWPPGPCRP